MMSDEKGQRQACAKEIYKILKRGKLPGPMEMAQGMEDGVFEWSKGVASRNGVACDWASTAFRRIYRNRLSTIIQNLDSKRLGNKELIAGIRSGEITLEALAEMSSEELYPSRWEDLHKRLEIEESVKGKSRGAITTLFTCGKCKGNEHEMITLQTRSADEGSTTYFTCVSCGHRWKH